MATPERRHDEPSRLMTFVSILKKFIGHPDIATARFSLPAQLLEPIPNLEFWNYLDRPDAFISMGKSDDELGRMLEVLRFWFTKDIKYVKGKPCKPYNSVLGEFFRCNWEVQDSFPPISTCYDSSQPVNGVHTADATAGDRETVEIASITEQTSHHPPVSAFYVDCPQRGIVARGFDQISAKFTGASVRISPGQHNMGIFVTLKERDNEEYQLTHPAAHVNGFLRGALSVSVSDTCYVVCPQTRIKAILQYMEEGWLSNRSHPHRVVGVVFRYDPAHDTCTRIKEVPDDDVMARIEGNWHEQVYYTLSGSTERQLLIDIVPLYPAPKLVPPDELQLPNESRRFWGDITKAILARQYGLATRLKHELEERQRQKAARRKERGETWRPRFFVCPVNPTGKPELTEEGRLALQKLHNRDFYLEESKDYGA
ncbi:hypothetical protein VTO42DRAFT_4318 [Malbranchea cinnamomea]